MYSFCFYVCGVSFSNNKCDIEQVHIRIKRYSMTELPQTDDGVAQWCKDLYVEKACILFTLCKFVIWGFYITPREL